MNEQHNLILGLMLYDFEVGHNAFETSKYYFTHAQWDHLKWLHLCKIYPHLMGYSPHDTVDEEEWFTWLASEASWPLLVNSILTVTYTSGFVLNWINLNTMEKADGLKSINKIIHLCTLQIDGLTKNICCAKGEDAVDQWTVNWWFKKFWLGCKNLNNQTRSGKPKSLNSKAVHQTIEVLYSCDEWKTIMKEWWDYNTFLYKNISLSLLLKMSEIGCKRERITEIKDLDRDGQRITYSPFLNHVDSIFRVPLSTSPASPHCRWCPEWHLLWLSCDWLTDCDWMYIRFYNAFIFQLWFMWCASGCQPMWAVL